MTPPSLGSRGKTDRQTDRYWFSQVVIKGVSKLRRKYERNRKRKKREGNERKA